MNNEIQSIIRSLENTNSGNPWFGRAVYELLGETDPAKASIKPNGSGHSPLELLYHMFTWAEFTLKSIGKEVKDVDALEKMDWRQIDPAVHTWDKGLAAYKSTQEKIARLLQQKEDVFLEEKVEHRNYNFRFLLNGLVQHNIYHLGQIAYINKFLV